MLTYMYYHIAEKMARIKLMVAIIIILVSQRITHASTPTVHDLKVGLMRNCIDDLLWE